LVSNNIGFLLRHQRAFEKSNNSAQQGEEVGARAPGAHALEAHQHTLISHLKTRF